MYNQEKIRTLFSILKEILGSHEYSSKKDSFNCSCLSHDDNVASLTVTLKLLEDAFKLLMYCHRGCEYRNVIRAVESKIQAVDEGILIKYQTTHDELITFINNKQLTASCKTSRALDKAYNYLDENGELLYIKEKYKILNEDNKVINKTFRIKREQKNSTDKKLVLFNLNKIHISLNRIETPFFIFAEGERDVQTLEALFSRQVTNYTYVITTTPIGAKNVKTEYFDIFRAYINEKPLSELRVVIFQDNDEPGRDYAEKIKNNLFSISASAFKIKIIPPFCNCKNICNSCGCDVTDYIQKLLKEPRASIGEVSDTIIERMRTVRFENPNEEEIENSKDTSLLGELFNIKTDVDYAKFFINKYLSTVCITEAILKFDDTTGIWRGHSDDVARQLMGGLSEEAALLVEKIPDKKEWAEQKNVGLKHVKNLGMTNSQNGIIKQLRASPELFKSPDFFNTEKDLLGALNGVINLRTGELLKVEDLPEDKKRFTNKIWFNYSKIPNINEEIKKTSFWSFLLDTFRLDTPSKTIEYIDFIQTVFGYCLTGETIEQKCFFCVGSGANGKSVLLNIFSFLTMTGNNLSFYDKEWIGTVISSGYFVSFIKAFSTNINPQSASPEVIKMMHKRIAFATESSNDIKFEPETLKKIVSSDPLTARALYSDAISFTPEVKLLFRGNSFPSANINDDGIWRRLIVLEFPNKVPEAKRNYNLETELKKEIEIIFSWFVEGARIWYQNKRLDIPNFVNAFAKKQIIEQDGLHNLLEKLHIPKSINVDEIYELFKIELRSNPNYSHLTKRQFINALTSKGYVRTDNNTDLFTLSEIDF